MYEVNYFLFFKVVIFVCLYSLLYVLYRIKIDCEYRLRILKPQMTPQTEPSAPPALECQSNGNSNRNCVDSQWENGRVLITVDEGSVTILLSPHIPRMTHIYSLNSLEFVDLLNPSLKARLHYAIYIKQEI